MGYEDRDRDRERRDDGGDRDRDRDKKKKKKRSASSESAERSREREKRRRKQQQEYVNKNRKPQDGGAGAGAAAGQSMFWDGFQWVPRADTGQSTDINASRKNRRLYLGNLPYHLGVTEDSFSKQLYETMRDRGMCNDPNQNPVLHVWFARDKGANYGFCEISSMEETERALQLDGMLVLGVPVSIKRPNDAVNPTGMIGGVPVGMAGPGQAGMLALPSVQVNATSPIIRIDEILKVDDKTAKDDYDDVQEDMKEGCGAHGKLLGVLIIRPEHANSRPGLKVGDCFLNCATTDDATKIMRAMGHRVCYCQFHTKKVPMRVLTLVCACLARPCLSSGAKCPLPESEAPFADCNELTNQRLACCAWSQQADALSSDLVLSYAAGSDLAAFATALSCTALLGVDPSTMCTLQVKDSDLGSLLPMIEEQLPFAAELGENYNWMLCGASCKDAPMVDCLMEQTCASITFPEPGDSATTAFQCPGAVMTTSDFDFDAETTGIPEGNLRRAEEVCALTTTVSPASTVAPDGDEASDATGRQTAAAVVVSLLLVVAA